MSKLVKPKQIDPSNISNYVLTTSGSTVLWAPVDGLITAYWTSGSSGSYSVRVVNDSTTDATGDYSVAEGWNTLASGHSAHAEGNVTVAGGQYSHAEGWNTAALGQYSHAQNSFTVATGQNSHAEGENTYATGSASHSEGSATLASGLSSHAGGNQSESRGQRSFVHGRYSLAQANDSYVFGNDITGNSSNTLYVPYLNINLLQTGTSINNLGIDSNGYVVAGSSGGGSFTGNTSGDCITDLWVSNIHSCSPLYINPGNEGNVYIGSANTITVDLVNDRLGIGTTTPTDKLSVNGGITASQTIISSGGGLQTQSYVRTLGGIYYFNAGTSDHIYSSGDNMYFRGGNVTGANMFFDNYLGTTTLRLNGGNVGIGGITPSHKLHVRGVGSTSATKSLSIENSSSTEKFYVRDDGAVNSTDGYWIEGIQRIWAKPSLTTIFWNHGNSSALALGSGTRNTLVGNTDSNQPQLTTGSFNSVFGSFAGMNISSGSQNIVVGNYNTVTPTTGSRNIIFGSGGMNSSTVNETLTFNGYSDNANEVVFGSDNYGRYKDWWFGQGKIMNTLSVGHFAMTWNASSALSGQINRAAGVTSWTFNGGAGTGAGEGTSFIWNVAPAGPTGTTQNSLVEVFRIKQDRTIQYQDGNQGAGKVLTSDANGVATWQTPSGGSSGATKYATTVVITGGTAETITHNLGSTDVIVQIKDSTGKMVIPNTVDNYQTNSVDVTTSITDTYRVIIIG